MESNDSGHPSRENQSWGQRHALTIMLVVMGLLFVLVMVVQKVT